MTSHITNSNCHREHEVDRNDVKLSPPTDYEEVTSSALNMRLNEEYSGKYKIKIKYNFEEDSAFGQSSLHHTVNVNVTCTSTSNSFTITTPNNTNIQLQELQNPPAYLPFEISSIIASQTSYCHATIIEISVKEDEVEAPKYFAPNVVDLSKQAPYIFYNTNKMLETKYSFYLKISFKGGF